MGPERRSLGRGLSALIPPKPADAGGAPAPTSRGAMTLPIEEILPGDAQPRQNFDEAKLEELAASIKAHGIIQPVLVRRRGNLYELVAGERRWRAAQKAGLKEIPAVLSDVSEKDALTVALVENLQREDLNAIEEAEAYQRLHDDLGFSQQAIAEAVGKDRTTVTNALRLLKLPKAVRQQVLDGELTMGHARALLALEDPEEIERLGREIVQKKWSVRQAEKATQPAPARKKGGAGKETEAEKDVRLRIQRALGTRVDIRHKQGKGTVVVHFSSYAELERLMTHFNA